MYAMSVNYCVQSSKAYEALVIMKYYAVLFCSMFQTKKQRLEALIVFFLILILFC